MCAVCDNPTDQLLIARFGRWMFERRSPVLPVSVAEQWIADWQQEVDPALRQSRLDPLDELVAASVLVRITEDDQPGARTLVGFGFSRALEPEPRC